VGKNVLGLCDSYDDNKGYHENERSQGDATSYDVFELQQLPEKPDFWQNMYPRKAQQTFYFSDGRKILHPTGQAHLSEPELCRNEAGHPQVLVCSETK
jgi:hypothetical protein